MSEQFANGAHTYLAAPMGAGDTAAVVASPQAFPATGTFRVVVDGEIMTVTGVAGNVFTVARASERYAGVQAAAAHPAGAGIHHVLTADGLASLIPPPPPPPPPAGVTSFNGRTGDVNLSGADVTVALGYTPPPAADVAYVNQANTFTQPQAVISALIDATTIFSVQGGAGQKFIEVHGDGDATFRNRFGAAWMHYQASSGALFAGDLAVNSIQATFNCYAAYYGDGNSRFLDCNIVGTSFRVRWSTVTDIGLLLDAPAGQTASLLELRATQGPVGNPYTGLAVVNPTPATAAAQIQNTPAIRLSGQAWDTGAGVNKQIDFRQWAYCIGSNPPLGIYRFECQTAGGGYVPLMELRTAGYQSFFAQNGGGSYAAFQLDTNAVLVLNSGPAGTAESIQFQHNGVPEASFQMSSGTMTFSSATGVGMRWVAEGNKEAIYVQPSTGNVGFNKFGGLVEGVIHIHARTTTTKGLVIDGLSGQTAPLLQLRGVSSTAALREQAEITTSWVDATDATRKGKLVLRVWDTAARDAITISATGGGASVTFNVSPSSPGAGSSSEQWGTSAVASGHDSTAVGFSALATGTGSVSLGSSTQATASNTLAIGQNAHATGTGACAVAPAAAASGIFSFAMGYACTVTHNYSAVLGSYAASTAPNQILLATGITQLFSSGTSIQIAGNSSTAVQRPLANMDTEWADSTDGTRKARLIISAWDTAAREGLRVEADGAAARVSLYGVPAVARQTALADATDLPSAIALINNLKAILKNLGAAQ